MLLPSNLGLHPHSGITNPVTYLAEGSVNYEDTTGATGLLYAVGGMRWMRSGGGVWHGGGGGEPNGRAASSSGSPLPPEHPSWVRQKASI